MSKHPEQEHRMALCVCPECIVGWRALVLSSMPADTCVECPVCGERIGKVIKYYTKPHNAIPDERALQRAVDAIFEDIQP